MRQTSIFHLPHSGDKHKTETSYERQKTKKSLILEVLVAEACGVTEALIFKKIGDTWHVRDTIRKLLQDGVIYRVGKGGQKDPFRYHLR